ncbi:WecB/TagA/CpsF family glycosyltransferase [Coprothermobacteraceae bacterium]|nr:WecB/TagA/CpsF family glycosyltransferase [Coprothermobacteraceae bacterium]
MQTLYFCGIRVDKLDFSEIYESMRQYAPQYGAKQVITLNPEIAYEARQSRLLKEAIDKAEFVIPDGIGIVLAAKRKGYDLERQPGIELAEYLLSVGGLSFFFYGAAPGVAEQAVSNLARKYDFKVVGTINGYVKEEEALKRIQESGADVLFVATGSPKQDLFIYRHKHVLGVKLALGIGGSFDVWAGLKERAPEWVRRLHLEWLWRAGLDLNRWKRLSRAAKFFLTCR